MIRVIHGSALGAGRLALGLATYVGAIVTANVMTDRLGLVAVGFGLVATAGTYAAGLALGARDVIQDAGGRWAVLAAIAVGGALSWALASPRLALASVAAFTVAEIADWVVYTPLRTRGWARAVIASNAVGAVVDTLVFLALAGFGITAAGVTGQLVGKVLWATVLPVLVVKGVQRALPRHTVRAESA